MMCSSVLLSKSVHGKMYFCNLCQRKISLMFGNISVSFTEETFREFQYMINDSELDDYFSEFVFETQVHIRTKLEYLFYSFTYKEILELRKLLDEGFIKFKIQQQLESNN